jgi:hypothetical protein
MDPDKYKKLQFNLKREEIRLKSVKATMDPSRLVELESINETLQYWNNQFQTAVAAADGNTGGIKILEQTKPAIIIYGFEGIDTAEAITSLTLKRQLLDRLQVNLVVFNDRIEIRCQIPIEPDKSTNIILNLRL